MYICIYVCVRKLQTLLDYCKEYNMEINEKKTKYMCVGKMNLDTDTLVVTSSDSNVTYRIDHCESYVYLGCVFTSDGSTKTALNKHVEDKRKHLLKLIMFNVKNQEMPFRVKLKVLNACFLSSVLYSCESWINVSLKPVEKLYYGAIKALLGVRSTTCNDLCLVEVGFQNLVQQKQKEFFMKLLQERKGMNDDPFLAAFKLAKDNGTALYFYIDKLMENKNNLIQESLSELKRKITTSDRSKIITYRHLNPTLEKCNLYNLEIPEFVRMNITRLRLSSHNLKIETGRWSRIPRDSRLCECQKIQTESHIIEDCILTRHIRENYNFVEIAAPSVLKCETTNEAEFIYEVLKVYM